MFPIIFGKNCSYEETLAVSGAGAFTFCYGAPFLYVTDEGTSGDGILKIYNADDPAGPALLSTTALPTDSTPRNPKIFGDRLFIPYRDAANVVRYVAIWNVSDRTAPTLIGQTANMAGATGKPIGVEVIGTDLFIAVGFGTNMCEKYSISNPALPTFTAGIANAGGVNSTGMGQSGSNLFITGQFGSSGPAFIRAISSSGFTTLDTVTGGGLVTGGGGDLAIHSDGEHLYTPVNNASTLWTVDISDPSDLVELSLVSMTQTGTQTSATGSIVVIESTSRLYVGRANGGGLLIPIMDITNLDTPVPSGSISTSGETVSDMVNVGGCPGFVWGQGTGAAIHLLGTAPLS